MPRKQVYRVGVCLIFIAVLLLPASYLLFGKIEKGKVIEIEFKNTGGIISTASTYPKIQFYHQNKAYEIYGDENDTHFIGEEVKVIFFENYPSKAIIMTFGNLFIETIIELPIGLLIWWALFKSYPRLFEPEREPLWFENFLYKKKPKKPEFKISKAPLAIKIIIYLLVIITTILLFYAIWAIYKAMASDQLSYQTGIGLVGVVILILSAAIQKVFKE